MIVRIKQTHECRRMRHANAGASDPLNDPHNHTGYPSLLRQYRRAGIVIPEQWIEVDVDDVQLATLRADPHVELEELTAAPAAETR